jgi:hypothetical protein
MNCCSNRHHYSEPLIDCYEKCIFCLGKFSVQHVFLTYNSDVFIIDEKSYRVNCTCRPRSHLLCMKYWLEESHRCPECSVYFNEIVEKKCCTFENLCCYALAFFCVSTFCLVMIGVFIHNKHII